MAWEQKKTNPDGSGTCTSPRAPPMCTQPIHRRWALSQGIQGVWCDSGRNEVYSGVSTEVPFGKMLC